MSRHLLVEPKNDAQLFDMLHALLGLGDFDDSGDVPWFKYRMNEIGKLKAMRRKRKISLAQMAMAGRYLYRKGISVKGMWEVPTFIVPAIKAAQMDRVSPLGLQVRQAIQNERSRDDGDSQWVDRLLRARGEFRREVLAAWAEERT